MRSAVPGLAGAQIHSVLSLLHPHLLAASTITLPAVDYTTILPELILLGGSLVLLLVSSVTTRQLPTETYAAATIGLGTASLIVSLFLWRDITARGPLSAIANSVDIDGFAVLFLVLSSCLVIVGALAAAGYLRREGIGGCEYYVLICVSAGGAMLMASANDLILIFLGLEILSIPLYVMSGMDQRREGSGEAAMKYLVLGAFSSAIFVYGIALIYGATGSTNLAEIAAFLAHNVILHNGVLLGGMGLLLVGFSFKVAAVPFHFWAPDVYVGAPTPATGFMAAIAKVGAFAALLRVFVSSLPTLRSDWQPVVWVIAVLTLSLGAIVAVAQRNVKRMLAYSSINHAGFILLGLQAATTRGVAGSLYYVFTYALLVVGSFAVVAIVGGRGDQGHDLSNYRGLARRQPVLATTFAVLLLAQAGAPFTTGFFAKLYVLEAAIDNHSYALAVIAMVSAAVAAFFYLRVVLTMFGAPETAGEEAVEHLSVLVPQPAGPAPLLADSVTLGSGAVATMTMSETRAALVADPRGTDDLGPTPLARLGVSPWVATALLCTAGATVLFGVWPQELVDFAHQATLLF